MRQTGSTGSAFAINQDAAVGRGDDGVLPQGFDRMLSSTMLKRLSS
jgi:hypothetical protein